MSRETEFGLHFAGITYYDGQGFMTRKARNIDTRSPRRQQGLRADNTTTELNLSDYFKANNMKLE